MPALAKKTTKRAVGKTIQVYVWVTRGGMRYNTSCLPHNDPDSEYQQIIRAGGNPAEYGIVDPLEEEFKDKTIAQLMQEIMDLRNQLDSLHRYAQI